MAIPRRGSTGTDTDSTVRMHPPHSQMALVFAPFCCQSRVIVLFCFVLFLFSTGLQFNDSFETSRDTKRKRKKTKQQPVTYRTRAQRPKHRRKKKQNKTKQDGRPKRSSFAQLTDGGWNVRTRTTSAEITESGRNKGQYGTEENQRMGRELERRDPDQPRLTASDRKTIV
jgi:hypothetical protein